MMTLHMDPIDNNDKLTNEYKQMILEIKKKIDKNLSIHAFRIVSGPSHTNLIFDCVIPFDSELTEDKLKQLIDDELAKKDKKFFTVITFDRDYC